MNQDKYINLFQQMYIIRKFEKLLLELFSKGEISGTTHTYMGQEAIAVGIINNLTNNDTLISSHRCHGHYLSYTDDIEGLLSEIMGKKEGICGGRGGSQHLHKGNFYSNGVQGNMFPVAAGMALANKDIGDDLVVIFIGDGTFGQGVIYETLNICSVLTIPLLVVIENNQYAQYTSIDQNFKGTFKKRIESFEISFGEMSTNDVELIYKRFSTLIPLLRKDKIPHVELINTYRIGPHSKGDDFREISEIQQWEKKDPLLLMEKKIRNETIEQIKNEIDNRIQYVYKKIKNYA
jgi:TPP-dependent pyruvate/acetoin dehydrogenase alpha subunit